jgi:hypothetical protein
MGARARPSPNLAHGKRPPADTRRLIVDKVVGNICNGMVNGADLKSCAHTEELDLDVREYHGNDPVEVPPLFPMGLARNLLCGPGSRRLTRVESKVVCVYRYSYSHFGIMLRSHLRIGWCPSEIVVTDAGRERTTIGARRTPAIHPIEPGKHLQSSFLNYSRTLTVPFFALTFCQNPVKARGPADSHSLVQI